MRGGLSVAVLALGVVRVGLQDGRYLSAGCSLSSFGKMARNRASGVSNLLAWGIGSIFTLRGSFAAYHFFFQVRGSSLPLFTPYPRSTIDSMARLPFTRFGVGKVGLDLARFTSRKPYDNVP